MVLLKELPPGGTIGNLEKPKASKNTKSHDEFLEKWRFVIGVALHIEALKKSKTAVYFIQDGVLFLRCPKCTVFKAATTDHFSANHVSRFEDFDGWFENFPHSFHLGGYGCNRCWAQKKMVQYSDVEGDGLAHAIMSHYPQLFVPYTDEQKEEKKREYKKRTGRTLTKVPQNDAGVPWLMAALGQICPVTGFRMNAVLIKGHPFNPSPNGLVVHDRGTYSQKKGHAPHETEAVCAFANIRQSDTNVKNLAVAFTTLFETMVADHAKTLEERAAEEEASMRPLKSPYPQVIRYIASHAKQEDKKAGRECHLNVAEDVAKRLKEVRMRCHTSGVLMSHVSGWNKAHADRIDNDIGHVDGNMEWKCFLFSGRSRVTREMFLTQFLQQTRVAIPDSLRAKIQAKLDGTPRAF